MKFIKKFFNIAFKGLLVGLVTLFLFEFCYRNYIIEFYKSEFSALNLKEDLEKSSVDIMVFGDSFSATSKEINYIDKLREVHPAKTILNFSVPGIGIRQINTFAAHKIARHNPEAIIYQIYVGNDLLDVETFSHRANVPWPKYVYRRASNTFLSLSFLNQRATVFKPKINYRHTTMAMDSFSVANYNRRAKEFLKIDAKYINNTIKLQNEFEAKYVKWLKHIKTLISSVPNDTPVYLVFVPHCTQVSSYYKQNFKALGAKFGKMTNQQKTGYEFYKRAKKNLDIYPNVTLLDPLENFQTKDNPSNRLYFANDEHLNKAGNVALYEFLVPYL